MRRNLLGGIKVGILTAIQTIHHTRLEGCHVGYSGAKSITDVKVIVVRAREKAAWDENRKEQRLVLGAAIPRALKFVKDWVVFVQVTKLGN